jgi:hypothetical protein
VAAVPSGLSLTSLRISWYTVSLLKFSAVHLKKRFIVVMESEGDESPTVPPVK